jgi:pyridoxal phosphate enzyme (YggS family)
MAALGLKGVREDIARAAARVGRDPARVTLVAVTKTADAAALAAAYAEGHRDFGENRAQEMAEKSRQAPGDVRWHFIGRLQGNKVRRVRPITHLLHSLDRPELIDYWVKGSERPPPVLVQVNVGREPQKAGVLPEEAGDLVAAAIGRGLDVRGLMTIAPRVDRPEDARPFFRELAGIGERLRERWPVVRELSMGMTEDYEVAVEEGATILRVGRAIFGPFEEVRRG